MFASRPPPRRRRDGRNRSRGSSTMSSNLHKPPRLLKVDIISAQDLAPVTRSMHTYAVAWVHPNRKLSTRVDARGRCDPTWNDKFVFCVDEEFLRCDTSAVMIEIYAVHWLRDVRIGTVRRPSGRPQGILNVGGALLDSTMRSKPSSTRSDCI
ncbi:hypothetical protein BT93_H0241 [Corymbia citriodora subsp. variegata]|nr:hypothetical protein BT93_H0241 [Corymbia citriodora subsp. variegata]